MGTGSVGLVVGASTAVSVLSLLLALSILPSLYTEINSLKNEVFDAVNTFKVYKRSVIYNEKDFRIQQMDHGLS